MKQVIQDLRDGKIEVAEVPAPQLGRKQILIRTTRTLISSGTERMLLEFGEASWIGKARQQPDKVRMVLDKVKTDGLIPTYESVRAKLDSPIPLGYCHVGVVLEVGKDVTGFKPGDRVISNGSHAEMVAVPVNLCAKIPDAVSDEEAVFTVLGSIALQGVRLAAPTLGECFVVTGLGIIGLITAQLLKANGCRVLGLDFDDRRLQLARTYGIEAYKPTDDQSLLDRALTFSRGRGVDGVLIAAATDSSTPLLQAAQMCRKKGRVVLIGVTGGEFSRTEFFKKELTFQVSCSYGPGRYDADYEENGLDYPAGYVRWTEGRNFEAMLDMLAAKAITTENLISHRFEIQNAADAYETIKDGANSLGVLLKYPEHTSHSRTVVAQAAEAAPLRGGTPMTVSAVGAGNYATRTLLPAMKAAGAIFHNIVTSRGLTSMHAARKFGFKNASTDLTQAWGADAGNTVLIATRHSSHAGFTIDALKHGKNVFVEKPLTVTAEQLKDVEATYNSLAPNARPLVMVGFNRRFSPLTQKMKSLLGSLNSPKVVNITINAGAIPDDHWTQSMAEGRRLIGEGCHFIDLARFLVGHPIVSSQVASAKPNVGAGNAEDHFVATLRFKDGSLATIQYFANGHRSFPKERIEVACQGRVLQLDNFRALRGFGFGTFSKMKLWRQDKGQTAMAKAFAEAIGKGGPSPIEWNELVEVARVSIELSEALRANG